MTPSCFKVRWAPSPRLLHRPTKIRALLTRQSCPAHGLRHRSREMSTFSVSVLSFLRGPHKWQLTANLCHFKGFQNQAPQCGLVSSVRFTRSRWRLAERPLPPLPGLVLLGAVQGGRCRPQPSALPPVSVPVGCLGVPEWSLRPYQMGTLGSRTEGRCQLLGVHVTRTQTSLQKSMLSWPGVTPLWLSAPGTPAVPGRPWHLCLSPQPSSQWSPPLWGLQGP